MNKHHLAKTLKVIRSKRNLTQAQMAELLGETQGRISYFLRNKQDTTIDRWAEMAEHLGVHPAIIYLEPDVIESALDFLDLTKEQQNSILNTINQMKKET